MNRRSMNYAYGASGEPEICDFRNNLSHSNYAGLGSPDLYGPLVKGFGLFTRRHNKGIGDGQTTQCTFRGFQSYKNQHEGIWTEDATIVVDAIVSDSHIGLAGGHRIHDVVLVGQTENNLGIGSEHPHPHRSRGGIKQGSHGGNNIDHRHFSNITCVNLPSCFMTRANSNGEVGQYNNVRFANITLINTPQEFGASSGEVVLSSGNAETMVHGNYIDVDGSLTGTAGHVGQTSDAYFLNFHHEKDNAFGWIWDNGV